MPDNGPRTRDFETLFVRSEEVIFNFVDAHVTFWPDGWAEVVGQYVSDGELTKGKVLPTKSTYNFSNCSTLAIGGKEKQDV